MGYESRLYVVKKGLFEKGIEINGSIQRMTYAEKIAEFNLCKVYAVSDKMRRYNTTDAYFYSDDGETEIVLDCYGEQLKEIPMNDAIKILEDAIVEDPDYRRYKPCLNLLKGFDQNQWGELVVLHYGY
jgi:hypothetical protein